MDPALPLRGTHVTFPESYPFGNVRGTRVMNTRNNVLSCGSAVIALMLASAATADMNIVSENFDSYTQATFEATWRPDNGNGISPLATPTGILVPDTGAGLTPPNDDPPGIQGQGVNILSDINEYDTDGDVTTNPFLIAPTSTQAVRISGDMFDDTAGNKRASIGLRAISDRTSSTSATTNIIELGHWNADVIDPTVATGDPVLGTSGGSYAYRVVLFDNSTAEAPLAREPNWQYFPLDPILDTRDNAAQPNPDGLVTPVDIGVGWHRYTATITETTVTLELDLFRDGLKNSEATEGIGTPGVDSSVTWTISGQDSISGDGFDLDPFNSLRIGAPSGITSANESVVDNISLDLIDLVAGSDNADFSENSIVDGADFLIWQQNLGTPDPLQTDGDANADDAVNGTDLSIWNTQYGAAPPAVASLNAVPEPSSAVLSLLLGTIGIAIRRRQ